MANLKHLDVLKQGVETWNQWRKEHQDIQPDLSEANLLEAHLERANLSEANLTRAILFEAHLEGAYLNEAHLEGAYLIESHLEKANLTEVHLEGANLREAHLEGAILFEAHLEGAILFGTHLEGAILFRAFLQGVDLRLAYFDNATRLDNVTLSDRIRGTASLVDVRWGGVNLVVIDWASLKMPGDEKRACQRKKINGEQKDSTTRITEYRVAVRANRQLAVVLRDQGLNEEADYFAYRAQRLERVVLRQQRKFGKYLFSGFLDILAGYGYRPFRSIFWYLVMIFGFAIIYFEFGHVSPLEAFVLSLTSFHGRGFFPGTNLSLSDPRVVLAAFEAVIGLLIEISFIATFTKRFLGS